MIIIGIDPDSKAHGVAIYDNGILRDLRPMTTMQFIDYIKGFSYLSIEVHIEDVNGKKAVWHNKIGSQAAYGMTCQRVGMCKQAQKEIERVCEWYKIKVVKHEISKMWKDKNGKKQFEMVTGWNKRSNEDTRSAAYFGFLGHKNGITKIN